MQFSVSVLLQSVHNPPLALSEQRWLEVIFCVTAEDDETAKQIAGKYAARYESEYQSMSGDQVRWSVCGFGGTHALEIEIAEGTELFSRFLRAEEGTSLLTPFED